MNFGIWFLEKALKEPFCKIYIHKPRTDEQVNTVTTAKNMIKDDMRELYERDIRKLFELPNNEYHVTLA